MQRRSVLRALAVFVGVGAGCAQTPAPTPAPPPADAGESNGGGETPTPSLPFEVTSFSATEGPDGSLDVDVTISNAGDMAHTGVVTVIAGLEDRSPEGFVEVTLDPGERVSRTIDVPVTYDEYEANRDLRFTFERR